MRTAILLAAGTVALFPLATARPLIPYYALHHYSEASFPNLCTLDYAIHPLTRTHPPVVPKLYPQPTPTISTEGYRKREDEIAHAAEATIVASSCDHGGLIGAACLGHDAKNTAEKEIVAATCNHGGEVNDGCPGHEREAEKRGEVTREATLRALVGPTRCEMPMLGGEDVPCPECEDKKEGENASLTRQLITFTDGDESSTKDMEKDIVAASCDHDGAINAGCQGHEAAHRPLHSIEDVVTAASCNHNGAINAGCPGHEESIGAVGRLEDWTLAQLD